MPFIHIRLRRGKTVDYRTALIDGVQRALVDAFGIPTDDRFAFVEQFDPDDFVFPTPFLGRTYTADLVAITITASPGRSPEQKVALYAAIARHLTEAPGLAPDDVLVCLLETARENWSFGGGVPLYASPPAV